jgi:hypothetical protein
MNEGTHLCPGGCGRQIPNARLACGYHWSLVPTELQRRLWAAYRRWQQDPTPGSAGAHLGVVDSCIEAIHAAVRRSGANPV